MDKTYNVLSVFTVCDQAAGEGEERARAKAFVDTFITRKRRIELMLALPMASLDRMAIQKEIKAIGSR